MFILPFPKSPGEHGAEDDPVGLIARLRRSFPLNIHMGVNGFIVAALLIQAVSVAGVIPTEVWLAKPGYAFTVCIGLVALSACILFSLRSLLMQPLHEQADKEIRPAASAAPAAPSAPQAIQPEQHEARLPGGTEPCALVLQSNRTTQIIVEKSLRTAGIQCVCVDDELAARQALGSRTFDLLILDASSPNTAALRDVSGETPILVLTSNDKGSAQLAADAVVTMPIAPRALASTALELIAGSPGARTAAAEAAPSPPHRQAPKLEPEPLDARALGDLQKLGGAEFVRDIVAQFVADAATVLASLAAAVSERDTKAFREQAHALRSCAANVGAQNVYRMCLVWRDLDAQEIAASGAQYMQMLEAEFERVRGALAPMLEPGDGQPGPDSKAA
jgi:HPt (histidine-containing phosphotransfer) domain-containing protein